MTIKDFFLASTMGSRPDEKAPREASSDVQVEESEEPIVSFKELGVIDPICEACEKLNFLRPTPIQTKAIPEALQGRDVIGLAQRRVLPQARAYPFSLLDVQLAQQATGAGTTFLRWRNRDRSSMGVALWEALLANPATPASLIDELYAMELQRIVLNMQISLTHSIARQALECANKAAQAEAAYLRRVHGRTASVPPTTKESP